MSVRTVLLDMQLVARKLEDCLRGGKATPQFVSAVRSKAKSRKKKVVFLAARRELSLSV